MRRASRPVVLALLAPLAPALAACGRLKSDVPADDPSVGVGAGIGGNGGLPGTLPVLDPPPACDGTTDVRSYGAVGDGVANDTIAIQRAIDTCAKVSMPVVVPAGTYLIAPLFLRTNTTLDLEAGSLLQVTSDMKMVVAAASQNGNVAPTAIINGVNVKNVTITGTGTIDGGGAPWWALQDAASAANQPDPYRPHLIDFKNADTITIEKVSLQNSPKFHVLLENSTNVAVTGISITSPSSSPNTDGVDPKSCKHVQITGCHISTGDDNVAVTSSGGPSPTASDIVVSGCAFGAGHGVSIGSYASGGVGGLTVQHCTFQGTQNGIRIKTARDRGGDVANLVYDDLQMTGVRNAIYFTEYYPSIPMAGTDTAQSVTFTTPKYHDITISNVTATGGRSAGLIIGVPESPVSNVQLENVNISATSGLTVRNAQGIHFTGSSITVTSGDPIIMQENATVDGLGPAAPAP
jgi:polygalacturonase